MGQMCMAEVSGCLQDLDDALHVTGKTEAVMCQDQQLHSYRRHTSPTQQFKQCINTEHLGTAWISCERSLVLHLNPKNKSSSLTKFSNCGKYRLCGFILPLDEYWGWPFRDGNETTGNHNVLCTHTHLRPHWKSRNIDFFPPFKTGNEQRFRI